VGHRAEEDQLVRPVRNLYRCARNFGTLGHLHSLEDMRIDESQTFAGMRGHDRSDWGWHEDGVLAALHVLNSHRCFQSTHWDSDARYRSASCSATASRPQLQLGSETRMSAGAVPLLWFVS